MPQVGYKKVVESSTGAGAYTVSFVREHPTEPPRWVCECKGFLYRGQCRHVDAVSLEHMNEEDAESTFSADDNDTDPVPF